MKCPYCSYIDGWDIEEGMVKGKEGGFYTLSNNISMERPRDSGYGSQYESLYACPNCRKVFIE